MTENTQFEQELDWEIKQKYVIDCFEFLKKLRLQKYADIVFLAKENMNFADMVEFEWFVRSGNCVINKSQLYKILTEEPDICATFNTIRRQTKQLILKKAVLDILIQLAIIYHSISHRAAAAKLEELLENLNTIELYKFEDRSPGIEANYYQVYGVDWYDLYQIEKSKASIRPKYRALIFAIIYFIIIILIWSTQLHSSIFNLIIPLDIKIGLSIVLTLITKSIYTYIYCR